MQAHYDGNRFSSPDGPGLAKARDVLRWVVTRKAARWPRWIENPMASAVAARVEQPALRVTLINHATVLIQANGLNILTDPVFARRVSPVRFAGPRRHRAAGIPLERLPPIDVIAISHTHYDHLDLVSLHALYTAHRPEVIAPLKTARLLGSISSERYTELNWWQSTSLDCGLEISMVPALHWTSRKLGDQNTSLWGGYVMSFSGGSVYFAGDTGFGDGSLFRQIASQFPRLRCALLPIGAYEPRWFMSPQHMNPEEAVQAFSLLGAKHALGIHHGTFQLTDEPHDAPANELRAALATASIEPDRFMNLANGEAWDVPAT